MRERNSPCSDGLYVFERCVQKAGCRDARHWEGLLSRMRACRGEMETHLGCGGSCEGEWQESLDSRMSHVPPERAAMLRRLRDELLDMEAELVEGHLRLVLHVARRYFDGGIGSLEDIDIIQEGCRGLLMAARKHDLKGYAGFSTYAVFIIRRYIIEEVSRQSKLVRVPRRALRKVVQARGLLDSFSASHGRLPTMEEMKERLDLEMDWILALSLLEVHHVSLDSGDDQGLPHADGRPDLDVAEDMEARRISEALQRLPERSKTVLALRLGLIDQRVETLKRVSEIIGVSVERVRQIENEALEKLRADLFPDP